MLKIQIEGSNLVIDEIILQNQAFHDVKSLPGEGDGTYYTGTGDTGLIKRATRFTIIRRPQIQGEANLFFNIKADQMENVTVLDSLEVSFEPDAVQVGEVQLPNTSIGFNNVLIEEISFDGASDEGAQHQETIKCTAGSVDFKNQNWSKWTA